MKKRWAFGCGLAAMAAMLTFLGTAGSAVATVTINEVRIDENGTDVDEYFELAGTPYESLNNLTYIVIGDGASADGSGVIECVVPLDGLSIAGDGFLYVAKAQSAEFLALFGAPDVTTNGIVFENSDNVTHMLVSGFTGALDDDLDIGDDGVLDVPTPWTSIVDSVALILLPGAGQDLVYSPNIVGPDGIYVPGHVFRFPNGSGSWNIGPFDKNGGMDSPGAANRRLRLTPKLTTMQVNATNVPVTICVTGAVGTANLVITALPLHGTLKDGGVAITSVPHTMTGALTYTPTAAWSGLDTLSLYATDSGDPQVTPAMEQELAVQKNTVVITEIMHAPRGPGETYEFVEIYNNSAAAVVLTRIDSTRTDDVLYNKTTTGNLGSATILANSMKIIVASDVTIPPENFRCEWGLTETDIIRVPLANLESMFASKTAGSTDCWAYRGSRVLLFGAGDVLLDAVDLGQQWSGASACYYGALGGGSSVAVDQDSLNTFYFGAGVNTENNDDWVIWSCSTLITPGQQVGFVWGDKASPGIVPKYKTSYTYVPCLGACCKADGTCQALTQPTCLADPCATGSWTIGVQCSAVTCPEFDTGACCLNVGACVNATFECECNQWGNYLGDLSTCPLPTCNAGGAEPLTINELEYNDLSVDNREFIELHNHSSQPMSLNFWSLEFFNGAAAGALYRTVNLPNTTLNADDYFVLGSSLVPNADPSPWPTNATNYIQNGGSTPTPVGANDADGIALLWHGFVVEGMSYAGSNGFTASGGNANGTNLPLIGVVDTDMTTLQRIDDDEIWTQTANQTPGAMNQILAVPTGACCMPNGSCQDDVRESVCVESYLGSWNGADTMCPSKFLGCIHVGGPLAPVTGGCEDADLNIDTHVDMKDWALYAAYYPAHSCVEPIGACCTVTSCSETTITLCGSGSYLGPGTTCDPNPCVCKTIVQAKAMPNGSAVTICDLVINSTTDQVNSPGGYSFQLQNADATGGITAYGATTLIEALLTGPPALVEGDQVDLHGTTALYLGLFELDSPTLVQDDGFVGIPSPTETTVADYQTGSGTAEGLESMLVVLPCVQYQGVPGTFAGVTNYSFAAVGTTTPVVTVRVGTNALNLVGTAIPTGPVTLIGIFTQYTSYQLLLRSTADILPCE